MPAKLKWLVVTSGATGMEGPGLEVNRLNDHHALMLPRTRGFGALEGQPQSHNANRSGQPAASPG